MQLIHFQQLDLSGQPLGDPQWVDSGEQSQNLCILVTVD